MKTVSSHYFQLKLHLFLLFPLFFHQKWPFKRVFPWYNGPIDEKIMKNDNDDDKKLIVSWQMTMTMTSKC